ncbi:MAG: hypothetical protein SPL65_02000 [Lachnospiraceae bacterium]|nr:hypothetical protein [Lachnospiraceae bacterium]
MDEFLGFGGLFDVDGDGSLDAGEAALGLMMMDDTLTDEGAEAEDSELELMTGYSRDDLELMDSEERAEILEDAGYEPDDFDFDL